MSPKYPRTYHLPYSPGCTSDDKIMSTDAELMRMPLILTEKADGSNTCLEAGGCYARSHGAAPNHPSFDAFKAFHAAIKHEIPQGIQIFGEWCYAKHSISYSALPSYFLVFGVRDIGGMTWASWSDVQVWAEIIGSSTVPVLGEVSVSTSQELRTLIESQAKQPSLLGGEREGIVVRDAGSFLNGAFHLHVGKWVRKGHVQTSEHWKNQTIVRNTVIV